MIQNLVFSGGGMKIYLFIGCLKYLEKNNILNNITTFLGTSAGALIATLLCIDFSVSDIENLLLKLDINKIKDLSADNIFNFFKTYGIDDGEAISRIIKIILNNKFKNENITFKEQYNITKKKLIISSTCLNDLKTKYFSCDTTPDLKIIDALLMSICIPVLFKPINYEDKLFVDGGLLSNYPIDYFKDELKNTLGIMICDINEFKEIKDITTYFYMVFQCPFIKIMKTMYELYKENTIIIESNVNFIDFKIEYNEKINMIDEGYSITKKNFENEEFKQYFDL